MSMKIVRRGNGLVIEEPSAKKPRTMEDNVSMVTVPSELDTPLARLAAKMARGEDVTEEIDTDENGVFSAKNKLDVALLFKHLQSADALKFDLSELSAPASGPTDVSSFTTEQTLTLIECVREQPALWDPQSGVSQRAKRDTWGLVAVAMEERGQPVDPRLCCAKFRILRDSYMRIIRKSAAKGTSAAERGRSWQFFDHLRFLGDGNGGPLLGDECTGSSMSPESGDMEGDVSQSYNDILLNVVKDERIHEKPLKAEEPETHEEPSSSKDRGSSTERSSDSPLSLPPLPLVSSSSSKGSSAVLGKRLAAAVSRMTALPSSTSSAPASSTSITPPVKENDTWSSFGEHVADALREMARLDEECAWDARLSLDSALLEATRLLRATRRDKTKM